MLARCRALIKGDQAIDDGPRPGLLTCLSLFPESVQGLWPELGGGS